MKYILLAATALSIPAAAAHAQMVYDGSEVSLGATFPLTGGVSNVGLYSLSGKTSFSNGIIGLQADISYQTLLGYGGSGNIYDIDAGLHANYRLSDAARAGVYYAYEKLRAGGSGFTISTYGAEALVEFDKLDLEVSVGGVGSDTGAFSDFMTVSADGYYSISNALELHIGAFSLIQTTTGGNSVTLATIGAQYSLANIPLSFGIAYNKGIFSTGSSSGSSLNATISYSFGAPTQGRRFGKRNFDYLNFVVSAAGA